MWQRIQTVFLLLVIAAMTAMLFLPLWIKHAETNFYELNSFRARITTEGIVTVEYFPQFFVALLAIIAIAIAAYEITAYKNRLTQMKVGALNSFMISLTLGVAVYFIFTTENSWFPDHRGMYQIGIFMPAIALIFNMWANRNIRKDEKLVRSVDRLR
jgi:uncharacterized membrane protein